MQPLQVGQMKVHKIFEMESPVPLLSQLPGVTAEDLAWLSQWYRAPDEITGDPETSMMTFAVHSWVIEIAGQTILVDTCCGNDKIRQFDEISRLDTRYLANLRSAGFAPEDIDMVMCTHLHFDHIGWNTRLENGKWVPTFPNARYVFSRRDFEYFQTNPAGEEVHYDAFVDSILPVMEKGQGEIVEADAVLHREIGKGVWLEPAFGHSPGCCTLHAQDDGPGGIFWGDVIHHPVQLRRFDLPFAFDMDPVIAQRVRKATLDRAADEGLMCFPAHFRRSSAGQVKREGDIFRYEFAGEG